ncbi:SRPBCC family protein [Halobacillus sp. A1]|uniref:SRPBCC family protein n=1 Tax=Halobacillus sp. A1 TaxID=2880262 RepID=UPI0020A6CE61|nr:SRPBCC family protein [Halobacillus sp. A1]MCP3032153.1 SRPBCC family protein [Halobacillus sp. A1]
MFEAKTVSVTINRPMQEVYRFVHEPMNLPAWAKSFCLSVAKKGDDWIVETEDGRAKIRFVEDNPHGVLDHYVTVGAGAELLNPMRVIHNGPGCEVMFTLFRLPEISEENFMLDAAMIATDLQLLKETLEL